MKAIWRRLDSKLAAVTMLVLVAGAAPGAAATAAAADGAASVQPLAQCGSAPCWTEFTVDGDAPPAGISLELADFGAGGIQLFAQGPDEGLLAYELAPILSTDSLIHLVINLGTYDPVVFLTTGDVQSYSVAEDGAVTLDVKPTSSSWMLEGCTVEDCGDTTTQANVDYQAMLLGFFTDLADGGAPPGYAEAMRGAVISTNAQAMSFPTFDAATKAVSFTLASPHLSCNSADPGDFPPVCGVGEPNTGFFKFFVPDALIVMMGIAEPSTVGQGSFTMTNSNGGTVKFDVEHDAAAGGVHINSTEVFTYSAPNFTLKAKKAPANKCTVPDVVGKKVAAAKQALTKAKCQTGKISKAYSDSVAKGKVISQSKEPGTKLAKGAKINLVVSKGKPPATKCLVPDVVGKKVADAKKALNQAKCKPGKATQAFSASVPKGRVISQSKAAGALVNKGTKVDLVVSKGKPPATKCLVPDVVGKKVADAKKALNQAKCKPGKVTQAFSATVPKGRVISQSKAAGALVNKGTKVDLVVSKGKK